MQPFIWEVVRRDDGSLWIYECDANRRDFPIRTVYDSACPDVYPLSDVDAARIAQAGSLQLD